MKTAIGPLRRAFSREHPCRIFRKPAIRIDAAGVGIGARQIFLHQETQQSSPVAELRRGDLGNLLVAEAFRVICSRHLLAAYLVAVLLRPYAFETRGPVSKQLQAFRADVTDGFLVTLAQYQDRPVFAARQRTGRIFFERFRQVGILEFLQRFMQVLQSTCSGGLLFD